MIPYTGTSTGILNFDRHIDVYQTDISHSWTSSGTAYYNIASRVDGRGRLIPIQFFAETVAKTGANTVSVSLGVPGATANLNTAFCTAVTGFGTLGKIQNFDIAFNSAEGKPVTPGNNFTVVLTLGGTAASTITLRTVIVCARLSY